MNLPIVTYGSVPPAATERDECFWCHCKVSFRHATDCPHVIRRAKVRMIVEYEVDVHGGGSPDAPGRFEFQRNEGSWCSSNAIDELTALDASDGCLCPTVKFAFISWVNDELKESR